MKSSPQKRKNMRKKTHVSHCRKAVDLVERLAKAEGIKPEELLARAGVSAVTWWRWKNDKGRPDDRTLLAVRSVSNAGV